MCRTLALAVVLLAVGTLGGCTDGILEAANAAREQFGTDRLMRFIENHKHLEADQFSQTLLNDLSQWSNQTTEQGQQDDITLLVIDFKHH